MSICHTSHVEQLVRVFTQNVESYRWVRKDVRCLSLE